MKRTYLKPTTEKLTTQMEGLLAGFSNHLIGIPQTGTKVIEGHQERWYRYTGRDDFNGEEAGSKFHHGWNLWDDEEE